jgi:hypothetical protein
LKVKAFWSLIALHFLVTTADFDLPERQVAEIGPVCQFVSLLLVFAGGEREGGLVGALFEGAVFVSLFEDLLALVDHFESRLFVLEGEEAVEGLAPSLGLGLEGDISAIIMGHRG